MQGNNVHALEAFLPRYAGKVDRIFIDPPYDTGNKDGGYNDNQQTDDPGMAGG